MLITLMSGMPDFGSVEVWLSLLTLTFLEIVLGIDNIVFITIAANKLAKKDQSKARNIGLVLAMVLRVLLLFGLGYLVSMQQPFAHVDWGWLTAHITGQSLILVLGGLFLMYKAVSEIHHKLEGAEEDVSASKAVKRGLTAVITQIALINIVFSFDSILTAIGLTDNITIMIIAIVASIIIMMVFAGPVSRFVNEHPTIQILGMSFLLLIGFMLIAEGAHLSHVVAAGQEIGAVPKGYLYVAIAFSLFVEFLNLKLRRKGKKPVALRGTLPEATIDQQ